MSATDDPALVKRYLSLAIENYERAMYLDLNDYFPSCNLARLYRMRNKKGDDKRATVSAAVTEVACERARRSNSADPWLKPTLLGAAFDAGDVTRLEISPKKSPEMGPPLGIWIAPWPTSSGRSGSSRTRKARRT